MITCLYQSETIDFHLRRKRFISLMGKNTLKIKTNAVKNSYWFFLFSFLEKEYQRNTLNTIRRDFYGIK